jgi:hypothetical protein
MITKKFMSEISKYRSIILGTTEINFLKFIAADEQQSAYGIFLFLKNMSKEQQELFNINPMAYKNVHGRIKRLNSLGLISEVEGNFKRNAIRYRITSRGIFQLFLSPEGGSYVLTRLLKPAYSQNLVLKTILYQYFKPDTILSFTKLEEPFDFALARSSIISNYIMRCCEAILTEVESRRHDLETGEEKYSAQLWREVSFIMETEIRNLILLILSYSIEEEEQDRIRIRTKYRSFSIYVKDNSQENRESIEKKQRLIPISIFQKDEKFLSLLKEFKSEFNKAYEKFILPMH